MLIRFEAANFRSIAAAVELSMVAIDREREATRVVPMLGESLLAVAAVYGPNASGKSNLIAAFHWLREAVQHSLRIWDDEIAIEPFAFDGNPDAPSEFVVESTIDGVRFEYVLEVTSERVVYEALFHYPEKKRRRIFEREGQELKLQRGLGNLSGTRELLTERALALSIARRFDEPTVSRFARDLLRTQVLGHVPRRVRPRGGVYFAGAPHSGTRATMRWFEERDQPSLFDEREYVPPGLGVDDRERALALLRLADLGIDDVVITPQDESPDGRIVQSRVKMIHRAAGKHAALEFAAESEGTRTWFQLIGPVLTALSNGSLLLFDELDASLHPTLSAQLIQLFHDPATNPLGAQLIFTSHDTSLLNHLNRDEVWLTEKTPDGSTRLGALADFAGERVRQSQNLERAYLHGRFGALPDVDQAELLRSLGLIG
ncbi:AAA family ATPase [Amycolatopsis sp. RTGN1]|uniref:AAA family ATPase n=1 Tax=Amycolatopsis ponsaeliensis TaxID=2992142 RepID=UPI00254DE095|nr:ATP-binding protein [Amycolatopsis sp. RTGN1]